MTSENSGFNAYLQLERLFIHIPEAAARLVGWSTDVTRYDYESYLRSTLWQQIREWVYATRQTYLPICGGQKSNPSRVRRSFTGLTTCHNGRADDGTLPRCVAVHGKVNISQTDCVVSHRRKRDWYHR